MSGSGTGDQAKMIIEKRRDKEDIQEIYLALNKMLLRIGEDAWYICLTRKRNYILEPSFSDKVVILCENKKDVIEFFKKSYYFGPYDPTLFLSEKLERLERW